MSSQDSQPEGDRRLAARQFGWWDMFVHPDDDPREQGERPDGERDTLVLGH